MKAPVLSRKLVLEAPARVPDGAGGYAETWTQLGTLWGEIALRGSGREVDEASRLALKITIRAAPQGAPSRPTAAMRFRDGARLYLIEAVHESDPSGRYLTCFAVEEVAA